MTPPCLPAKSLFKRLLFALMSRLHIILGSLEGLAGLHAILRLTELEHRKGLQVQLGKLSHFMGREVEVQRGVRASTMCS